MKNVGTSSRFLSILVLFAFLICVIFAQKNAVIKRFEYKHSFRAPLLAQRDGSIPFWMINGDAIASSEQLRLAPSIRSRKGAAWNKRAFVESVDFELEVALKITGQGRIGADGLAIWYTSTMGAPGPVFGSNNFWTGLAVFLDSFDNDDVKNNPAVSVMINDGTRSYEHQNDGASQVISSCQKDFRNKPFPVRLQLLYRNNVLVLSMTDGMTEESHYDLCLRAENIFLPKNGYFGISAATGGLADDHDVFDFSVYSLSADARKPAQQIPDDERQKYEAEFVKQKQEYEEDREKYKKLHPEKAKDDEDDALKYYEDATSRELRLVYESQAAIYRVLQQVETKIGEVAQTQNIHTSMLQQGVGAVVQHQATATGGTQPVPQGVAGVFQLHEKNEVLQSLRDLSVSFRDLKNYVNEIFTRTYKMEQTLGSGSATGGGIGLAQESQNTRSILDNIQNEIRQLRAQQQPQSGGSCADLSCASSSFLTVIIVIQSAVLLIFVYMRSKQKAKFY